MVDYSQPTIVYAEQAMQQFSQLLKGELSETERDSIEDALLDAHEVYTRAKSLLDRGAYGTTPGYIYFFRLRAFNNKWDCPIKIGKSVNIPRRASEIGTAMPWPIELIHTIKTYDMTRLEGQMHRMFDEFRMEGEWFRLSQEAIEWVCGHWTYDRFQDLIDGLEEIREF